MYVCLFVHMPPWLVYPGTDATVAIDDAMHSEDAMQQMKDFLIGTVAPPKSFWRRAAVPLVVLGLSFAISW